MSMLHTWIFAGAMFLVVATIASVLLDMWIPTALETRITTLFSKTPVSPSIMDITSPLSKPIKRWIEPLIGVTMNAEKWLTSPLRIRFSNAGINGTSVVTYFFTAKLLLAIVMPMVILFLSLSLLTMTSWSLVLTAMVLSSGLGYYLPNGILDRMVAIRQHQLFLALPDALDLLRVCVEAGLGLDAAVQRVGREIQIESEALAQEFSLLGLELRAGAGRANALRNLALRIGLADIDGLVSMLIQADRFGTSMADSLRMYSESLRTKRRLVAEEAAAKLPVKILLPLIFCVFPSLLTVLMGPAVINMFHVLAPRLIAP
jgi:tight adherence protein C